MADEPLAATPKRRAATRRPKGAAEPSTVEAISSARPGVVEDGASLDAELVHIRQGAVGRVEAGQVTVEQGAIGAARAEHLTVERGAVGAALAEQVEVRQGYARSIIARQVQLDRSAARIVIAADVRTNQTAVMFLVARKVAGDVRVLLDWRGALVFGAAFGIALGLIRRARPR